MFTYSETRRLPFWVCFVLLTGLLGPVRIVGATSVLPVGEYVRLLETSYREVRSLRAEFTQTHTWGGRRRVESGTVYFARGGRMRWEYREPSEKLFLSDSKRLYLYIPATKQLTVQSVKQNDDFRVPFRLLLSRVDLRKVFSRIEFAEGQGEANSGTRLLRGLPKSADQDVYREVLLEVTRDFDVRRLVVRYADDSAMEFTFDRLVRNPAMSPSLFHFSPPEGTEIVEKR